MREAICRPPSWTIVLACVAAETRVARCDLLSDARLKPIAEARQLAMHVLRRVFDLSLPETGRRLGGRDHTTVLHAERKIEALVAGDWGWASRLARVLAATEAVLGGAALPADRAAPQGARIPAAAIIAAVVATLKVDEAALLGFARGEAAAGRRLAMVLLRRLGDAPCGAIGARFGRRGAQAVGGIVAREEARLAASWPATNAMARLIAAIEGRPAVRPCEGERRILAAAPVATPILAAAPLPAVVAPVVIAIPAVPVAPVRVPVRVARKAPVKGARIVIRRPLPAARHDFGDPPADLVARRVAAGFERSGDFRVEASEQRRWGW